MSAYHGEGGTTAPLTTAERIVGATEAGMAEPDRDLANLCKLATIAVEMIRDPASLEDAIRSGLYRCDERELQGTMTCLRILADAFVELSRRQGMTPKFRVQAGGTNG